MNLADIRANVADQNKGAWFALAHPVTGAAVGIRFRVAGPDSAISRQAQLALFDRLAELADDRGRISAKDREAARQEALAARVLDWDATEEGQPVPFSTSAVLRILRTAPWVEAQVDLFAGDRSSYWPAAD